MASDAHVIVVDGPTDAGDLAIRAVRELERAWSRFIPDSDVSRLNRSLGRPVQVNDVTITLVETMLQATELTSGLFDPTILPALLDAGYATSVDGSGASTRLPVGSRADRQRRSGMTLADLTIDRRSRTVVLPPGIALDPGGLGKGLAADLVVAELLARGATGALVGIGGDLAAAGTPPNGSGWQLAVENPFDMRVELLRLAFDGGGVATSSTLSRRWQHDDGTTQHHLIDPATGSPSQSDVVAVTILAPCGWQAEAHATAAILGDTERLLAYTDQHRLDAIATSATGRIIASEKLLPLLSISTQLSR